MPQAASHGFDSEKQMVGFCEFYETFYQSGRLYLTTADEMRDVFCAYKQYRRYQGLRHELTDAAREAFLASRMEYHIGACEFAELAGDPARTIKHREAFLEVWKLWFKEMSDEETVAFPHGRSPGFWRRAVQKLKNWVGTFQNKSVF